MDSWSNEFVKGWMIGLGLDSYLYLFQDEDFDGRKLVALTEGELVETHKVQKKVARKIILKRNEILKLQANERRNSERPAMSTRRSMSFIKRASLSLSMRNLHDKKYKEDPSLSHNRLSRTDIKEENHNRLSTASIKVEKEGPNTLSKATSIKVGKEDNHNRLSKADIKVDIEAGIHHSDAGEVEHMKDQVGSLEQLTRISIRNALHHNPVARDVCVMLEKLDYVEEWDLSDVLIWLDFVGFPNYKPNFKAANISGKHLLALSSRDLSRYLKIYDEKDARTLANHIRLLNVY